jgi:WS/DGAT/MGAT family acyltransferase
MSQRRLARRLSSQDASFLYREKPTEPLHVMSCTVYDAHIGRDEMMELLQSRMHLMPRYRQKVVFPPFGLAHPTWEDDPDFDIGHHVEEATIPPPADDRVLGEVCGRLHEVALDRRRPLWKVILLQRRPDGGTVIVWKIHHAMVDGVSGVELTVVPHDLRPDAPPPVPPATPWQPRPLPDPLTLLQDAVRDQLTEVAARWTDESFRLLRPTDFDQHVRALVETVTTSLPTALQPAPRTPFNGPLSGKRHAVWAQFSFPEVRRVKSVLGGTVNDLVLAVVAGGLGRYLRAHGHATDGVELRAMCPVSMRRSAEGTVPGNFVSMVIVPLHVGIGDAVERLAAERAAMDRLKSQDQAGGFYRLTELANQAPPSWQAFAAQLTMPNPPVNTVCTNVPGPQIPLYLAGRKMVEWYPIGPMAGEIGLFNTALTYNQKLTIGATLDREMIPDGWFYAACLEASFAELRAAAERTPSPPGPAASEPAHPAA